MQRLTNLAFFAQNAQMKTTKAIGMFLRSSANENNRDLVDLWNAAMETQLCVDPKMGTLIPERKGVWIYEDSHDSYEFRNIRIPFNAKCNPINNDGEIDFPVNVVAEGIGSTGWDWQARVSCRVGFDFDSIVGHAKGLNGEKLEEIKGKACELPYVEVRKSTSGSGIHLYVSVDAIPTANHSEHANLGRLILEKMSRDVGFDFLKGIDGKKLVDVCGDNMWIWHRKMTLENEGLKLLKSSERLLIIDDLPSDWEERIKGETPR